MTKEQKREALLALERGCQIAHSYINCSGKTCAIGALAKRANVTRDKLEEAEQDFITICKELSSAITYRFGLSIQQQISIQNLNDKFEDEEDRTGAVMRYVNSLPTTD